MRKVVVEGNAGMGKTTLCTMLTEGWAEGTILTQFDCVLLLPLREASVASATTLSQLFKLFHSSERIRTSAVDEMEEREGERVLIIADGWDELDDTSRSKGSFLYDLLFRDVLPFTSVLITSRPSASAPLHNLPSVDRLVEVVGFNEENIKQYMESEFEACPYKAVSLLNQLDDNPLIGSVCSVPLNCAIVCNLWHTLDQVLPTTLTELYTQIVLNVILRNLRKESVVGLSLENFDSIPEDLQDEFWKTCEFAYKCLLRDQIVFSESELASSFPHISSFSNKFQCFGLLQSAQSLLPVGQALSFHFAHLSFQEFLAALHLVTLPTEEKLKVVEDHAESVRFRNVWRFVFGLGCKKQDACSKKVVCLDDEVLCRFLDALKKYSDKNTLLLSHCALESGDDAFSIRIAKRINGYQFSGVAHTPHDCVAVLHVLRHSTVHCPSVEVPLSGCGLRDKQLKELADLLSDANGKLQVSQLGLWNNRLTDKGVNDLFEGASASFTALHWLYLDSNNLTDIPSFMRTSCNTLTTLSLSHNPLGVSGIQSLEAAVQAGLFVNLWSLHLSNTLTDDADINGALLTTLLPSIASHCPHLRRFYLGRNNLGVPGACAVGQAFPLFTRRKDFDLNLSETRMNSEAVTLLSECACATDLDLFPVAPRYELKLDISDNPLGYDGLLVIFRMLRSDTCTITRLVLHNTADCSSPANIGSQSQLPTNPPSIEARPPLESSRLTKCNVGRNNFSGIRVRVLTECIRVCRSLEELFCVGCSLQSSDITNLMTHLKSFSNWHSNLKWWDLEDNSIDDEGLTALIDSDLFPSLMELNLDDNPVSDEAQERLGSYLKANMEAANIGEAKKVMLVRSAVLTEWERTQSPPKNDELLEVFEIMWEEVLELMINLMVTYMYELPLTLESRPATPSDDESFHSATEELDEPVDPTATNDICPTVQSPHRMDQQEPCEGATSPSTDTTERDTSSLSLASSNIPDQTHPLDGGNRPGDETILSPSSPAQAASPELTLSVLNKELKTLTKPIPFGVCLGIPQDRLEVIQQDHRHDTDGQKIALFQYIAKNHKSLHVTWRSIADALLDVHAGNLSLSIRTKYCSTGHDSQDKEH